MTDVKRAAAGLWCRLNRWEYPEIDHELRDRIMHAITDAIGLEACLVVWRRWLERVQEGRP